MTPLAPALLPCARMRGAAIVMLVLLLGPGAAGCGIYPEHQHVRGEEPGAGAPEQATAPIARRLMMDGSWFVNMPVAFAVYFGAVLLAAVALGIVTMRRARREP